MQAMQSKCNFRLAVDMPDMPTTFHHLSPQNSTSDQIRSSPLDSRLPTIYLNRAALRFLWLLVTIGATRPIRTAVMFNVRFGTITERDHGHLHASLMLLRFKVERLVGPF